VQKLTIALLMLFAFAVPWEYSLDLGEPFGNVARLLGLGLLLAAVPWVLMARGIRRPGLLQWLVLALYLYFAGSYYWTLEPETTVSKVRAYFQVFMIVWLVWEVANTPMQLRGLLRAFVAGSWVLALLTLSSYASAEGVANQIRFAAEGQDPNDVARFLDLGFAPAALLFSTETGWVTRALALGYIPAGLMGVLLTASRGGFSGALVALFGSAVLLVLWRPRAAALIFLGLAATAGAVLIFVPGGSLDRLATLPQEVGGGDWNDRLNIWDAGWHAFTQAPWWGSGAGTFTEASQLAAGDTAHNTLMAMLVTGGLAATTIFVAILGGVAWAVAQSRGVLRVALGTTFAVWLITSMVGSVEENRATWLLFGMIAVAARLEAEEPRSMAKIFSGERRQAGLAAYAR
jgi:hypothetical protein